MNYPESEEISKNLKVSKKILVNLHRGPDPDSFACALALYAGLKKIGKEVDVVCTSNSKLIESMRFLPDFGVIKSVDFEKFDFNNYDLFIASDTQTWQHIVDNDRVQVPDIPIIVIDHHPIVNKYGTLNLVDLKKSSCAEMIYLVLKDLGIKIDSDIATTLLTGILGDTNNFQFSNDPKTLVNSAELMELGGDKGKVVDVLFRSEKFETLKLWGEFLSRMSKDKDFFYTAVPYDIYSLYGKPAKVSSQFATLFGSMILDVKFGIIILEKEKGIIDISLRSKSFDISKMAEEIGGGGHPYSAGARVSNMPFEEAVEKVLKIARKYDTQ